MRLVFWKLVFLLTLRFYLAQGFGSQPSFFGPKFPKVLGVNYIPDYETGPGNNASFNNIAHSLAPHSLLNSHKPEPLIALRTDDPFKNMRKNHSGKDSKSDHSRRDSHMKKRHSKGSRSRSGKSYSSKKKGHKSSSRSKNCSKKGYCSKRSKMDNKPIVPPFHSKCDDIPTIGCPILLFFHAEQIIEEIMKLQNRDSFVRYIYFSRESGSGPFSVYYKLIFELRTQLTTYYLGILLDSPSEGIGSVKFIKFIFHVKFEVVRVVLRINEKRLDNGFVCGDLKMIFSSYGNDPRTRLPYDFPGFNRNAVPPAILKALKEIIDRTRSPEFPSAVLPIRDCSITRFVRSKIYYSYDQCELLNGLVPPDKNPFTVIRCDPTGAPIVRTLHLVCQYFTDGPKDGQGSIWAVKATFNVPFRNTLETTNWYGREHVPKESCSSSKVMNIELHDAEKMEVYFPVKKPNWYGIMVYNFNKERIGHYLCGGCGKQGMEKGNDLRETILVKDLLGFWGGKAGDLENDCHPLSYLGYILYQ